MTTTRDAEFADYVVARLPSFRRLALLTQDWHRADHFVVERGALLDQQYTFTARRSNPADLPSMTTSLGQGSCYFYPDGQSARQVINGYRVVVNTIAAADGRPATYQVCAADAYGLNVFNSVDGDHPVIAPVTLFRHLKLLGTDAANWTADPIR
jgi:hypothetical protein